MSRLLTNSGAARGLLPALALVLAAGAGLLPSAAAAPAAAHASKDTIRPRDDASADAAGAVARVSISAAGRPANGDSSGSSFSPDGTRIAFISAASNLVRGPLTGASNVFVKDLATGAVIAASSGMPASPEQEVGEPAFSPDGTKLAFTSFSKNGHALMLADLTTRRLTRVAASPTGITGLAFSPDGKGLAYSVASKGSYVSQVVLRNLTTGQITTVSKAGSEPAFSADGSRIVFESSASNLVPGDTNGVADIFVKNLRTGRITRVSTGGLGEEANGRARYPSFSPDGKPLILFQSEASNLVPGDSNDAVDVFVKDLRTGAVTRVNTNAEGTQSNGVQSILNPTFSPDGTRVAFDSTATNLVPGDTNDANDVFVKDLVTGEVTRISTGLSGEQANDISWRPAFSPDGTRLTFSSYATNLVPGGGAAGQEDVYVKDLG